MAEIHVLDHETVDQIAAGEVVERPLSVVKELVENSVDAEASKISVEISNECRNIRVADNGLGIHPDDILLAFSKHATSKIETSDDIYNVKTMHYIWSLSPLLGMEILIYAILKITCYPRTISYTMCN